MDDRLTRIRKNEKISHTEIYSNEQLYNTDSWLNKPIKTIQGISKLFADYESIRVLDLGSGIGRNSIYLAKQFSDKDCLIDCVDLLDIAIDKLNQNAAEYGVSKCINGIVESIEGYEIEPDSYDLIIAVSALEHVESIDSFVTKLKEVRSGLKENGVVCLVINSEITETNSDTLERLEPQFEVNISTDELQDILDEVFSEWLVIKKNVKYQEYDIPRNGITSRLSTNVVTYVGRK